MDALFHSVLEALESAALVLREDGSVVASNSLWQQQVADLPAATKNNYFAACEALFSDTGARRQIEQHAESILAGKATHAELIFPRSGGTTLERLHLSPLSAKQPLLLAQHQAIRTDHAEVIHLTERLNACETLLATAAVMLLTLNSSGEVTYINPKGCEILGYSPAEILGKNWFDYFLPLEQQAGVKKIFALLLTGEVEPAEYFENAVVCADGQQKMIAWSNNYLRDAQGYINGILSSGTDITAHHQLQESLKNEAQAWIQAMDQSDDVVYLLNRHRRLVRANRNFYQLVKGKPEELLGRHITAILHPHGEATPCPICRAQEEMRDARITLEADSPDNPAGVPVEVRIKILRDDRDLPTGILMSLHDLTSSRELDDKLRLAAAVFRNTHDGMVITDANGYIVSVNTSFSRITGYSENEVREHHLGMLQAMPDDQSLQQSIWNGVHTRGFWQGEVLNRRKNGETYPAWLTINPVTDRSNVAHNFICVFSDISLLKQSEEKLEYLAHHDTLTGLPNRLLLQSRLEHAIEHAKRNSLKLAVLFLDLDRFKIINDSLGHPAGDELLKLLADRMSLRLRAEDTLARLGGDEFIVLLDRVNTAEEAAVVARDLIGALSQPFDLAQQAGLYVGCSIGISLYPDDGSNATQLIRNADAAMYQAKNEGRNTYSYYTRTLTHAANKRLTMESRLRGALERGEFVLHYQPQVRANGEIVAVEALVRWQHPEEGLIPPHEFIPVAEETGLIIPLGQWIFATACHQVKQWQQQGMPELALAVNVSTHEFNQPDLVSRIADTLIQTGLNPAYLELEITESALMCPRCEADGTLHAIKALGVRIAIDDFGTGYSSLGYLRRFPIDTLKIDRSFVHDIPASREDTEIAATIIAMAHNLNLSVVAEGVETEEQTAFLREHGCEFFQGYHFSRPLPAGKLEQLFSTPAA